MRILIITDQFPPVEFGGMAQHALHMARYLSQRHEVLVATLQGHDPSVHANEAFDFRPVLTKRFLQYDAWTLRRLARSFRADVIHACTAGMADEKLCREFPVVTRVVGNDFIRPWYGFKLPFRRLLFRLPGTDRGRRLQRFELRRRKGRIIDQLKANARVAANSGWTSDRLAECGVTVDRIRTMVGGLDTRTFHPSENNSETRKALGLPAEGPIIATAGNLIRKKGVDTVLRALAQLTVVPKPQYVIVGDGSEQANLSKLAGELGLQDRTFFVGRKSQAELAKYYQASDVYVLVSQEETMGRTYFEAGACGIPVIAARVGGVPDVVEHGGNGLLVDDPEDVGAVVAAIQRLLEDGALREQMGQAGLKRAREEFSWESVGAQFEELLTEAATGRRKRQSN